ncbi:MAG: polyprenyl synthetase family protein [Balneolaceae bacterium]
MLVLSDKMDIKEQIKIIDYELNHLGFEREPSELYEPIRYFLKNGGKRLRPLLTLLGCYLFTDDYQRALKPGIGVEIFHNFTLVHDDIMDNAPIRRGNKTVHEKWNKNVAILSGDTMLFKAYDYLIQVDKELVQKIIALFNQCAVEVCEGQQHDMNFENRSTVSEQEYIRMIQSKTASLLGFSLQLGALVGGANDEDANNLKCFGLLLGTGFQLKDDLLDVYGEAKKFGKRVGGDIIANKKTYLLIQALNLANSSQKEVLEYWLQKHGHDEEKVEQITEIYNQIGIKELAESKMNEYFTSGFQYLDKVSCSSERKNHLIVFSKSLIYRES